jgi:hypothetical protein
VVKEDFEFRNNRSGTRVITRDMADFLAVKSHFEGNNLSIYTFFPKSEKPIKTVIRHLPLNTYAEDICDGLVSLGFDVVGVKQMTTTRRSPPEVSKTTNLPLFLITLPRTTKSQEIVQLRSLCHIAIKLEDYRTQSALTQSQQPTVRPRLGQLQATSPMFVVPPAQGKSGEGKRCLHSNLL